MKHAHFWKCVDRKAGKFRCIFPQCRLLKDKDTLLYTLGTCSNCAKIFTITPDALRRQLIVCPDCRSFKDAERRNKEWALHNSFLQASKNYEHMLAESRVSATVLAAELRKEKKEELKRQEAVKQNLIQQNMESIQEEIRQQLLSSPPVNEQAAVEEIVKKIEDLL